MTEWPASPPVVVAVAAGAKVVVVDRFQLDSPRFSWILLDLVSQSVSEICEIFVELCAQLTVLKDCMEGLCDIE
jgi:hypothetical protein